MPAGVGTGTKQKGRRRIRREISRGFPESGNNGAEKAITGVLHQNWDETQNWNWRKSMRACFLMTVRKKDDLDRRSAEELGGVEGGESVIRIMYEKKSTLNKRKSLNVRILYFLSLLLYQKALIKYHLKDSMPNFGVISE